MSELPDGLTLTYENDRLSLYHADLEFCNKHTIKCSACGTIIMPCRSKSHCNCGRIYNGSMGITVFKIDDLDAIEL